MFQLSLGVRYAHVALWIVWILNGRTIDRWPYSFTTCLVQTTTALRLLFPLGWHFMPRECDFFIWNFWVKNVLNFVPLWWRNNSMMSEHISDLCWLPFFYHKDPYRIKSVSIFYGVWDNSIYVIFHTFKNVTITS